MEAWTVFLLRIRCMQPHTYTLCILAHLQVLWPGLQTTATQGSLKPPANYMALGDNRIDVFRFVFVAVFCMDDQE